MGIGGLGLWELVQIFLIVALLFLAPIFAVVYFIRWQVGRMRERQPAAGSSPEEILRHRFARGEISEEELGEMVRALRDSSAL